MATAAPTFKNSIGGESVDAAGGESFETIVPATGEVLGSFPRSAAADVDRAVAAAKAAYEDWRLVPAPERGNILFRFAELLREHKAELTDLMTREMGKVRAEAGGDVQEAIDMSYYMGGEGRRLHGQTTPSELRDKFMMSVRMPVGVVGAITPWNFPIAIPAWKLCPALVCGNTVVLKPAEDTPLLADRFVALLAEAGVPPGVVNVVHGYGEEAGEALVRHPDVPVITFTGSRETGVAGHEGGGRQPQARPPRARRQERDRRHGRRRRRSRRRGHRLVGVRHERPALHRGLARDRARGGLRRAAVEARRGGRAAAARAGLGRRDRRRPADQPRGARPDPRLHGHRPRRGREAAHRRRDRSRATGFFYRPTVFADVEPGMRIAQEEIFGPTTALIPVGSFDEAVAAANSVQYGLSSSIYTRDVNRAFRAMRDLQTGITYINAGTTGAEVHLPFGGMKQTGNGHREAGQAALDVFTEWKSIYVDYSGRLQRAQIDNA